MLGYLEKFLVEFVHLQHLDRASPLLVEVNSLDDVLEALSQVGGGHGDYLSPGGSG